MARLPSGSISLKNAEAHDALMPLLRAMFRDFQDLSKKKPDGVLNKQKMLAVNRLMTDVISIVGDESNRVYIDVLDEDDVPQYTDVVILLGQTVAVMETFHDKYYGRPEHGYGWAIK